jgi:hypothetical protein
MSIPKLRLERLLCRVGLARYDLAAFADGEGDKERHELLADLDDSFAGIAHDLTELGAGPVAKETKPVNEPERQS